MSKRLKILAKNSSLTNISIQYGKEKIKFNLYEELIVNESRINEELKNQPSYYGFLSLLAVKLKRSMGDKKAELEKIKAELFIEKISEILENPNIYDEMSNNAIKLFENQLTVEIMVNKYLKLYQQ